MQRISTPTKQVDLFGPGKHGFRDGDTNNGVLATRMDAAFFNDQQEELIGIVEGAGFIPAAGVRTQLAQAIQSGAMWACQAAGTSDALIGAFTPAVAVLKNGMSLRIRAAVANALTNPTFTPNNAVIAPKPIVKGSNTALAQSDIAGPGHWLDLQYDQTLDGWVLLNPANGIGGGGVPIGTVLPSASNTLKSGYLKTNGAAVSRTTYAGLFADLVKSATVVMSIASPGVVTWNNHGRSANDVVKFTSTGVLPTGITGGVTYYVVGSSIATNTFQVSATPGGAAINFTVGQSGIHTAIHAPWGDGDGSTTFNVPLLNGEGLRFWDDGRGIDLNRVFGSAQLDAMQGHFHSFSPTGYGGGNGGPANTAGFNSSSTYGNYAVGSPTTDGTNGTPRIASETRMRNVALFASIKF